MKINFKKIYYKLKYYYYFIHDRGYPVGKEDKLPFLLMINTRKPFNSKDSPHAHLLLDIDIKPVFSFFLTEEIPKTVNDLRFIRGSYKKPIPTHYKKELVDWANGNCNMFNQIGVKFPTNWDYLKWFHKRLWPDCIVKPYPKIEELKVFE